VALLTPGRELKVVMALRGTSAREVARRAGLQESALSRILNDRQPAPPDLVARIRDAVFEERDR
jgi:transcriptional regulator with XRE-family HTH domain